MLSLVAGHDRAGWERDMHPEYVEKAPRGAGWYILLEDGTLLQGGPYPSEEATWAEVALRESREEAEHGRATPRPAEAAQSPSRQSSSR